MKSPTMFVSEGAVLAVAAAAITASPSWARSSHNAESRAAITLHVYDYARANRATLTVAEDEASRILAAARITAHWVDCPITHSAVRSYPNCLSSISQSDDYIVSIAPNAMAARFPNSAQAFGVAIDSLRGPIAHISFATKSSPNPVGPPLARVCLSAASQRARSEACFSALKVVRQSGS